jgi:hypothetical protein
LQMNADGRGSESSREFREWTNQSEKMIRVFRINSQLIAFLTKFICGTCGEVLWLTAEC